MADSPIKDMGAGALSVLVLVAGKEIPKTYYVLTIDVIKEINRIPSAKVVLFDGDVGKQNFPTSVDSIFAPGAEIEIKLGFGTGKETSVFKGVIVEQGIRLSQYHGSTFVLKCKDKALRMTVGRKNKMFFDQKDSEIISAVVGDAGGGVSVDVEATTVKHKKLVRHSSTDWDFVQMRADACGLVTIVEGGKLTIKKPTVSKKSELKISYGKDLIEMNLTLDSTYQVSEVKANSWSFTDQKLEKGTGAKPTTNAQGDKDTAALSSVITPKELLQTNANVTVDMLQPWTDSIYQRRALSRIRGSVKFYGSAKAEVGKTIELFGIGARFSGDAYVSKVRHTVERSQWLTETEFGLPPRTYVEDNPGAMPLPAGGLLPPIHGLQIGVVKQIHEDPDGEFRVLVNIPIIDELAGDGIWVRMAHYHATKDAGFVFYPEVGDEVILGFLDNDPTHGVILGSLYSSSKLPLSSEHTPDDKNTFKAISVSKGKMKFEFDTSDGKEIITIITPKKNVIILNDSEKSITIEDPNNKNKMVMDSAGILLDAQKDIVLKAKGNIKMEATQNIETKSTANTKMEATANFEIKATAQAKMEGTAGLELKSAAMAKLEGSAMTEVKGGVVMIN